MMTAAQIREALALLGWTPPTLAKRAFLAFDDVNRALDDVASRRLGGLQLGAIRAALEAAGVECISEAGGASVGLRKVMP